MARLQRLLAPLLPSLLVLLGAHLAGPWLADVADRRAGLAIGAPLVLLLGVAVLGLRFHRTRLVFVAAVIGIVYGFLVAPPGSPPPSRAALVAGLGAFLPLNVGLLALLRERGFLTVHGAGRAVLIAGQVALLVRALPREGRLVELLSASWLDPALVAWTPLPQPALALTALVGLGLLGRVLWRAEPLDGACLGALAAGVWALHAPASPPSTIAFGAGGAAILGLGLVQETYRLAYLDELTGLPGRRALEEAMRTLGRRYTVAMLDVDHFKKFNDTYGHEAGDQVLRMVGERVRRIGAGGRAFRYGGEEFTLLFPGKRPADVEPALEELRAAVGQRPFRLRGAERPRRGPRERGRGGGRAVTVTISLGAAERPGGRGGPEAALKAADQALYKAKKKGRNRVVTG